LGIGHLQLRAARLGVQVPHGDDAVPPGRGEQVAFERDGEHGAALGRDVLDALAAGERPDADRAVVRAADELVRVGVRVRVRAWVRVRARARVRG
jgi:hypothetical protein